MEEQLRLKAIPTVVWSKATLQNSLLQFKVSEEFKSQNRRSTNLARLAALKKAETRNLQLQQQLEKAVAPRGADRNGGDVDMVEKPSGSDWSIQKAMGLQGRGKKYDNYKAIQVRY